MSKTKNPLKLLLKRVPSAEEYQVAWEHVRKDGSWGSVILAGTLVEDSLRELLVSRKARGVKKATFSAKIKTGLALKLYGKRTFHDLQLLRDLRNAFAHGKLAIDFDTLAVKWGINEFHCHTRGETDLKKRFYSVATLLLSHLVLKRKDPSQGVKGLD
jgi:hypothetical protein